MITAIPAAVNVTVAEYRSAAAHLRVVADRVRPIAPASPVAECVGDDHPHSAEISYPTPSIPAFSPTEVDYSDYVDVLEGLDDESSHGPTDEDWADYHAHRAERDYHPAELDEMRIRHGVIDCYA